jgi:hypothetical protein
MKRLNLLPVAALLLPLTGCYFSETIETRITLNDKASPKATVSIEYSNISSGEADLKDVKKDFEELIEAWQEDGYLLERADEGLFVKNRELLIRDGKIVGRETGIMKDIDDTYKFWDIDDEKIMLFDDSDDDYELVETNGKILKTDKNILIVWPKEAAELRWTQRLSEKSKSESFDKNQPVMVKMLQEYLANQQKKATGSSK